MNPTLERINILFKATDLRDWETVVQCFSPKVVLDYASMTGQAAATVTPQEIVESWKSILPGFEYTHHQLGNGSTREENRTATAFCYGTATHYLEHTEGAIWTVVGTYDCEFEKGGDCWRITKMKFNFKFQTGNTTSPQVALARVSNQAPPLSTKEQNKQRVQQFFKSLESKDVESLINLFATDGKHSNPYHSGLFPTGATGREEIRAYWTPVFPNFDGMEFHIDKLYAMEDPTIIYVKFTGNIKLKNNAGLYSNDYHATFTFNAANEITEYVELFNPITAAKAFGLLDKIQ
ncbi:MAG: nuclear transport factor 2 family protein [Flavobacteriaceae bacterium]